MIIITETQRKTISKYIENIDELTNSDDVNELLFAIDNIILDKMDINGELDSEGINLQLIYDQIYNSN